MKKKYFYLFFFTFTSIVIQSQTTLTAGDIAIIGYDYDAGPGGIPMGHQMAIATLVPISSGTVIRITDYGYDETTAAFHSNSTDNTAEGSIQWTTTSSIPAGTVIPFTIVSGVTPSVTGLPGTVTITGWTNTTSTTSPVPAGGDNWFIFQGSSPTSVSTFIFAYCNPFAATHNGVPQVAGQFLVTGSGNPNNGNSYLPPSLTLGQTAIALNTVTYHGDNNVYVGTKTGIKSQLLTEICKLVNWSSSETTRYDLAVGGANFSTPNPVFSVTLSTEDFVKSKFKIYPNPVSEKININFEDLDNVGIEIVDITGKVLRKEKLIKTVNSIDVSDLSKGIYFIKTSTNKGYATIKFSKE